VSAFVAVDSLPDEPLAALRVLADSEVELDRIRRQQVIAARTAGASWQQIGHALGVSRQSAWEMFTADARAAIDASADDSLSEDEAMSIAVEEVRSVRRRRRSA
jgi:hypothetical protein